MRQLRVGMAQINTTVGDFMGNIQKIIKAVAEANSLGVDLLTFPSLQYAAIRRRISFLSRSS